MVVEGGEESPSHEELLLLAMIEMYTHRYTRILAKGERMKSAMMARLVKLPRYLFTASRL
jgi:hypothetical protein